MAEAEVVVVTSAVAVTSAVVGLADPASPRLGRAHRTVSPSIPGGAARSVHPFGQQVRLVANKINSDHAAARPRDFPVRARAPGITSSRVMTAIGTGIGIEAAGTFGTVIGGALTMVPGLDGTPDFTHGITFPIILTGTIPMAIIRTVIIRVTKQTFIHKMILTEACLATA
jgi:hypothetical protein